jgi:hypothetical protein
MRRLRGEAKVEQVCESSKHGIESRFVQMAEISRTTEVKIRIAAIGDS